MDKATKTIQCEFPDGTATIVITESRELCLRAYETARLFTRVRDKEHHKKLNRQLEKVADSFGNITDI